MNRRFFDDLLDSSTRRTKEGKRRLTLPVSIAVHAVLLFAVVVVPYLRYNELPEPALGTVRAFFVESAAAPPPPPPPPAAPKAAMAAPRISKPKPVLQEPEFRAPIEVPKEIPKTGCGGGDILLSRRVRISITATPQISRYPREQTRAHHLWWYFAARAITGSCKKSCRRGPFPS